MVLDDFGWSFNDCRHLMQWGSSWNQTVVISTQIFFSFGPSHILPQLNTNSCHKLFCLLCLFSSLFQLIFKVISYLINHKKLESHDTQELKKKKKGFQVIMKSLFSNV